jgi:hypothetical protein
MKAVGLQAFARRCIGLGLLLLGVSSGRLDAASPERPGPMVGKSARAFQIQGIFDEPYSLETFKGHILVMQFGASW